MLKEWRSKFAVSRSTLELWKSIHGLAIFVMVKHRPDVILCSGDTFSTTSPLTTHESFQPDLSGPLTQSLQDRETEMIESALTESRESGRFRWCRRNLGVPPSTLESKIKQLKSKTDSPRHPDSRRVRTVPAHQSRLRRFSDNSSSCAQRYSSAKSRNHKQAGNDVWFEQGIQAH